MRQQAIFFILLVGVALLRSLTALPLVAAELVLAGASLLSLPLPIRGRPMSAVSGRTSPYLLYPSTTCLLE